MTDAPSLTMGIEEEYLLVDKDSRNLVADPPKELMEKCEARLGHRVSGEFLKSQIEIGTGVCHNISQAREELIELRGTVVDVAGEYNLAPIAASTHPFATWRDQHHTEKERYNHLAQNLQAVVRRLLICGMHVHIGIEDPDLRIDLMNQASYFLPHLLALSTSSPFWSGEDTGLRSYRLTVFDALPRTGVPERLDSFGEYQRLVDRLVQAGMIEDGSMVWWDLRPSARYPTLEMRMTDVCTYLEDTLTIAALFQCILSMLYRLRCNNQRWRVYPLLCVQENRWRAQRYGVDDTLIDFGLGKQVPYGELIAEVVELCAEDAEKYGCQAELQNALAIARHGTSANRQVEIHTAALAAGDSKEVALNKVVDWLIGETQRGLA
jgi:carboxylate-amine ligase